MIKPRAVEAGDEWWSEDRCTVTVYEPDEKPHNTGLVNIDGAPIYRVPARAPMGFMR
jgi:hypothetical protein